MCSLYYCFYDGCSLGRGALSPDYTGSRGAHLSLLPSLSLITFISHSFLRVARYSSFNLFPSPTAFRLPLWSQTDRGMKRLQFTFGGLKRLFWSMVNVKPRRLACDDIVQHVGVSARHTESSWGAGRVITKVTFRHSEVVNACQDKCSI